MRASLIGAVALAGIASVVTPPSASAASLTGIAKHAVQQTQTADFSAQKKVKKGGGAKAGGKKPGNVVGKKGVPAGKGGRGPAVGRGGGGSNAGAAAAGAAIGLAIGIIATEAARQHNQAVQECIDNHPSYNPNTGIWVDRHGGQHRCP